MAIEKRPAEDATVVLVTFSVPAEAGATHVHLVGDFNDWSTTATAMTPVDGEGFEKTLSLSVGQAYRFRYLLDGHRWENDWMADNYVPNDYGGEDSLVDLAAIDGNVPHPSDTPGRVEAAGTTRKPKGRG